MTRAQLARTIRGKKGTQKEPELPSNASLIQEIWWNDVPDVNVSKRIVCRKPSAKSRPRRDGRY